MASLVRDRRGSLFVEFLLYMPLLMLIWWLMLYVHDIGTTGIQTARQVRECAWLHAVGGCQRRPPQCAGANLSGVRETDDAEFHARASSFRELGADLPFLREDLEVLLGDEFDVSRTGVVEQPPFLGGEKAITRRARVMCEDRVLRKHTVERVFRATCQKILGRWCP